MNQLLSYTTYDGKGLSMVVPLVGLPQLDTRMGDISPTKSKENLLCCKATRHLDGETNGRDVEVVITRDIKRLFIFEIHV